MLLIHPVTGHAKASFLEPPCQQRCNNAEPFRVERLPAPGLARPAVPIRRVALIAFLAVQVRVNPRAIRPLVLLRGFVSTFPVTLCVPPQSGKR